MPFVETKFKNFKEVNKKEFYDYDVIWYGYLELYLKKPFDLRKSIITIHDPGTLCIKVKNYELFSYPFLHEDAKIKRERKKRLKLLKKSENIVCISK
jgi:hypothetical protein